MARAGDEHRELLPAEARDEPSLADDRREAPPQLDQHLVARLVAVRVVDALEAVDVEQQQARADGGVGSGEPRIERRAQPRAVGELGERVGLRLALGLRERDLEGLRHARALGDVGEHPDEQQPSVRDRDAGTPATRRSGRRRPCRPCGTRSRSARRRACARCDLAARLVVLVHGTAPGREHVGAGVPSEQTRDAGVDVPRVQVAVGGALQLEEDVVDRLDEPCQPLARVAQLLGDATALGDVEAEPVDLHRAVRSCIACTRSSSQRALPSLPTTRYSSSENSCELRPSAEKNSSNAARSSGCTAASQASSGRSPGRRGRPRMRSTPGTGVGLAVAVVERELARVQVEVERPADLLLRLPRTPEPVDEGAHERADAEHEHDARGGAGDVDRGRAGADQHHHGAGDDGRGGGAHGDDRAPARQHGRGQQALGIASSETGDPSGSTNVATTTSSGIQ